MCLGFSVPGVVTLLLASSFLAGLSSFVGGPDSLACVLYGICKVQDKGMKSAGGEGA